MRSARAKRRRLLLLLLLVFTTLGGGVLTLSQVQRATGAPSGKTSTAGPGSTPTAQQNGKASASPAGSVGAGGSGGAVGTAGAASAATPGVGAVEHRPVAAAGLDLGGSTVAAGHASGPLSSAGMPDGGFATVRGGEARETMASVGIGVANATGDEPDDLSLDMGPSAGTSSVNADAGGGSDGPIVSTTTGSFGAQSGGGVLGAGPAGADAVPSIAPATPVPEPSTWLLLVGGLVAIGLMTWRRSSRRN